MKFIDSQIRDVKAGARVVIVNPSNLYECELGDDVFVGPFVEIQSGVVIGARSKIQSHSFICSLVEIGEDCFVGHGVTFINDTFSGGGVAGGDASKWEPTTVGSRVAIGSNVTILPVQICPDAVIGAGSVVTKNVEEPGIYAGNPARKIRNL